MYNIYNKKVNVQFLQKCSHRWVDSNLRSTLIDIKGVAQHIRDTSVNDTFELLPKQLQQL